MEDSSRDLGKTNRNFNLWNDARILPQVTSSIETHDRLSINSLKIFNMIRYNNRNSRNTENENHHKNADKTIFNYARADNPTLSTLYSINTDHLQNPYKKFRRFEEGYVSRDNSKDMYRSMPQDSSLRWRYNNVKRGLIGIKNTDQENEKIQKSKKKKSKIIPVLGELVKQFCEKTSLHGLHYIGDSRLTVVERLFWLISFISALITAAYYIYYVYQKWNISPMIISLSPEPASLDEFPFPSLTICNMNHAKKTEADRITNNGSEEERLLLEDACDSSDNTTKDEARAIEWNTVLQFMLKVSHSCTDMLHYCMWRGNLRNCEDLFNRVITDEGLCCNFNAVNRMFIFYNPRDWTELNITYPFVSIDWNAENGYNKSVPTDALPWRPYGAGQYFGLTLFLDVEEDEYYCSSTSSAGFKMLLHNPVETPKIADFSFAVTPGEETRIIIRPRISTASKTIVSIPQKKRKCFFSSERKLRFYRTYTQRNCILECEANFTQKLCDCVQNYMPKSAKTPICGKAKEQCAYDAKRTMETKLYDESGDSLNISKVQGCNCWPGCFEINYNVELSQSKLLPSAVKTRFIKKDMDYFL